MFILYSDPGPQCNTVKLSNEIYFLKVAATEELFDIFNLKDDQNSLRIILKGDPGSGKRTLVRETAYHWANGYMLSDIKLLLIVNFYSSLRKKSINNLHEIITYCSKKATKQCEKYFENLEGKGLMIILDDYYELPTMKHHQFFVDLIQKKIFPKCKLLMTSQSDISLDDSHIKQIQKANIKEIRIAKILGLTSKGRDEYLSSPEACVNHLCLNPMNLKMYLWCLRKDSSITLSTQTVLVDKFICLNITHVSGHKDIICNQEDFVAMVKMCLGKLAYEKLIKNKLEFSGNTFKKYKFKKEYVTKSLLKYDSHINKYTFAYAAIQYYLAAGYIIQNKLSDRVI